MQYFMKRRITSSATFLRMKLGYFPEKISMYTSITPSVYIQRVDFEISFVICSLRMIDTSTLKALFPSVRILPSDYMTVLEYSNMKNILDVFIQYLQFVQSRTSHSRSISHSRFVKLLKTTIGIVLRSFP